jgi:hypothetical protein
MTITAAQVALVLWGCLLLTSLIAGGILCKRQRASGVWRAAGMMLGALLTFGFVSGLIGLYEITDYIRTIQFWISMSVGLGGVLLFSRGVRHLKTPRNYESNLNRP